MTISTRQWILIDIVIGLLLAYGGYRYYSLTQELATTKADLGAQITTLQANLAQAETEKLYLNNQLIAQQERVDNVVNQFQQVSSTVGTLQKLSQTDKELLQKYSKIYFLNENYVPDKLVNIDPQYLFLKDKPLLIHQNVWPYLQKLLQAAASNGVPLQIISAFRSFDTQATLKSSYKVTYGSSANAFSADQGYSEHQLGTALDFTTPTLGQDFSTFDQSTAYQWLINNAYRYGFELSYPKGNTYYQFEPWHWRFVGVALATRLHQDNKNFYDLDQREIDKYLVNIFD